MTEKTYKGYIPIKSGGEVEREIRENYWKEEFDQLCCCGIIGKDHYEIIEKHTHVDILNMEVLMTFSNFVTESENEPINFVDEDGHYIKKPEEKIQQIGLEYNKYGTYEFWFNSIRDERLDMFNDSRGIFKKGKKKYISNSKQMLFQSDMEFLRIRHSMPFTEKDYDHPFFDIMAENYIPYEKTRCGISLSVHLPQRFMPVTGNQLVGYHLKLINYSIITE